MSADWSILTSRNGLIMTGFSSKYCSHEAMRLLAPSSVSEGKRPRSPLLLIGLADFFDLGGALGTLFWRQTSDAGATLVDGGGGGTLFCFWRQTSDGDTSGGGGDTSGGAFTPG